ncbi:hypothetical protein E4T47_07779 [Aureobasidium subglaciale]|nr:hypothetical protein E4T47_07779 [Aureobasidium subglaciale]
MSSAYVANSSFGRLVISKVGSANAIHPNEFPCRLTIPLDNVKLDDILASLAMIESCGAQRHQIPDDGDLTRLMHAPNNDTFEPRDGLGPALTMKSGKGDLVVSSAARLWRVRETIMSSNVRSRLDVVVLAAVAAVAASAWLVMLEKCCCSRERLTGVEDRWESVLFEAEPRVASLHSASLRHLFVRALAHLRCLPNATLVDDFSVAAPRLLIKALCNIKNFEDSV